MLRLTRPNGTAIGLFAWKAGQIHAIVFLRQKFILFYRVHVSRSWNLSAIAKATAASYANITPEVLLRCTQSQRCEHFRLLAQSVVCSCTFARPAMS